MEEYGQKIRRTDSGRSIASTATLPSTTSSTSQRRDEVEEDNEALAAMVRALQENTDDSETEDDALHRGD